MMAYLSKMIRLIFVLPIAVWLFPIAGSCYADEAATEDGHFVTIQNPITDATITQIQNSIDRALSQPGRRIKKVVFDFNPDNAEAGSAKYGSCRDLAQYILKLKNNGTYTIAFVHAKTYRHTVLPVLACNDLVMSHDAKIGDVAEPNEIVPADEMDMYAKIAGEDREAVVLKMLDKNVEVVLGRLGGKSVYVDLANAKKKEVNVSNVSRDKPVLPRGSIGLYSQEQAMQFGLCTVALETRQAVVEQYNLNPAILHGDRYGGHKIKAVKIEVNGILDETLHQKLKSQLSEVRSRKENTIFFVLECGGGSAKVAREMADEIRELRNDEKDPIWTVAFVPNKAPDLATFLAFACSEIVMFKGSEPSREATLGEFENFLKTTGKVGGDGSNTIEFIRRNLGEIAEQQGYSKLIVDGMLDRDSSILLVHDQTKPGNIHELMTGRQYELIVKDKTRQLGKPITIKQPGTLLTLNATLAKELRIVQATVDNKDPKEVYSLYEVTEKDVRDSKPGWLDDLAAFLRRTEVSILLVVVAFAGLILEFKMPGSTLPGLVALVCFVLFFWAHAYANGSTIYLAIALFVLGLLLLGVEIFILPGFGVTGISGVFLILAGVGLATLEKAPSTSAEWTTFAGRLMQYGMTLVAAGCISLVLARFLPKIPYANRLMLVPPGDKPDMEGESELLPGAEQAAALLGLVGTATSMLRPAGMARIGDHYVDVVTEGNFIEPGTPIQVIEVEGTRIVVKKV